MMFGGSRSFVKELAKLFFHDGFELQHGHYRRIYAEEAIMLVLGRLGHSTATMGSVAWRLGLKRATRH
jgi:hypothetical protein